MRSLAEPAFPDDDGAADPALAAALGRRDLAEVLAALGTARVVVPVVAVLGETDEGPGRVVSDKSAEMAAVLMRGHDGRTALLAFSSLATMQAWDPQARPVPVSAREAAAAARAEGAAALVLDVAGPVSVPVEDDDLARLAQGWTLARLASGELAWVAPGM